MYRDRVTGHCRKCNGWRWFRRHSLTFSNIVYQCEDCNEHLIYRKK